MTTFDLQLEDIAHGGSAIGRHERRTVFVPYAIPGERITARTVEERGRVIFAEGLTVLDASADRVFPRCPHFGPGRCGRCHWQHIDYPAQLLLKQDVLTDQLERIGGLSGADVRPVIAAPQPWAYNHHMTLLLNADGRVGFRPATTPDSDKQAVFPVEECHLLHPALLDLYERLDLERIAGLRSLRLQIGSDGAIMLILTTPDDQAPELELDLPASINLRLSDGSAVNLIGDLYTHLNVRGRAFRAHAACDFPANLPALPALLDATLRALDPRAGQNTLDLYAGIGLFSAFIAPQVELLTLVEDDAFAADDADRNLADFENVDILEGRPEDVLPELQDQYDSALIAPPPDGLSVTIIDELARWAIPRLVYLSSDPAVLARDAKRLVAQGYTLSYAQPIDLNPQTYFIDTIARFDRA
jgi:23S rRNA (uracil1939-C5)-methyltransferase